MTFKGKAVVVTGGAQGIGKCCDEVAETMAELKPDVVILNACAAQLKTYGRLIMDDADVESVCRAAPNATVIASHMDTVAHATLTRKTLKAALERRGIEKRVLMPGDGEEYFSMNS